MNGSNLAVVDASVVFKWQLDDEDCVIQARVLRNDFDGRHAIKVIAPTLLAYELANALAMSARRKRITPASAAEAMDNLMALGIELKEMNPARVLLVALEHGLTAYDAAYVALAEAKGCSLWTGDRQLCSAVSGKLPWVRWIRDYKSA